MAIKLTGSKLWNNLPIYIKDIQLCSSFKSCLKDYLLLSLEQCDFCSLFCWHMHLLIMFTIIDFDFVKGGQHRQSYATLTVGQCILCNVCCFLCLTWQMNSISYTTIFQPPHLQYVNKFSQSVTIQTPLLKYKLCGIFSLVIGTLQTQQVHYGNLHVTAEPRRVYRYILTKVKISSLTVLQHCTKIVRRFTSTVAHR